MLTVKTYITVGVLVLAAALSAQAAPPVPLDMGRLFAASPDARDHRGRPRFKANELLVRFKPGASAEQIRQLHGSQAGDVLKRLPRFRIQRIRLKAGVTVGGALSAYKTSAIVEAVEPNVVRYLYDSLPNDPFSGQQWALAQAGLPRAWDITTGSSETIIAVIDSGAAHSHPDLVANMWVNTGEIPGNGLDDDGNGYVDDVNGYDFAERDADPADGSPSGHGTHVAGIIAAVGNNGLGVAGVNWNARIMALKALVDNSSGLPLSEVLEAMEYALENGARIVNCSFGAQGFSQLEYDTIEMLKDGGVIVVGAAGNDGADNDANPIYPASYTLGNIISVAAGTVEDQLADFSNYGLTSVDLTAPGDTILSTLPESALVQASVTANNIEYDAFPMEYAGLTVAGGITRPWYDCGLGQPEDFPPQVSGNIAVIARGELFFYEKTSNAMAAGAAAVIIYNNGDGNFNGTLGDPGSWIPAVSISKSAGEALMAAGPANVNLVNALGPLEYRYGYNSGTSMAAPFVSGLAGLLAAVDASLDYAGIKAAILDHVDPIPTALGKTVTAGRTNAFKSLCSLVSVPGDLTADAQVTLADAVLALQIAAGMPAALSICALSDVDVDLDGRIGLGEAIYPLQKTALVR